MDEAKKESKKYSVDCSVSKGGLRSRLMVGKLNAGEDSFFAGRFDIL